MTVQLVTSAAARPPCAPRAAACGCRGCPPGTLLSGSSGGGSRQNPATTQHIVHLFWSNWPLFQIKRPGHAWWPSVSVRTAPSWWPPSSWWTSSSWPPHGTSHWRLSEAWDIKHWTRLLRYLSQSFIFLTIFGRSRGLLEPAVAAAKATAAGAKLDLQCFNANKGRLVLVHPFHSNTNTGM